MSYPCRTRVVPVSYPCRTHVVPVSYPCRTHVVPMSYRVVPMSYPCRTHVVGISDAYRCAAAMLSKGKTRFSVEEIANCHVPTEWVEKVKHFYRIPDFPRKLRMACPCIGVNMAGRAFQDLGIDYELVNSYDVLPELQGALESSEGGMDGINLGADAGDLLKVGLQDLDIPVDLLVAGPPCPPWASNGKKAPDSDSRTKVFCTVLKWVVFLIKHGGLLYALLENVTGILNKLNGSKHSFMELAIRFLDEHVPEFAWRVDTLNALDYKLPHSRRRVFLQGVRYLACWFFCLFDSGKIVFAHDADPPPPLPPFGTVTLRDFLQAGLPATPRNSLTKCMAKNLADYEKCIKDKIEKGEILPGPLVVCELDRAFGKTYNPAMSVDHSPCLKTGLKYLFVVSTEDMGEKDENRAYFRWILPTERPALQGCHPSLSLHLSHNELVHACGNAYPCPLIAACAIPVLDAIRNWGGSNYGGVADWPPKEMMKVPKTLNMPDVEAELIQGLSIKDKQTRKAPKKQSAGKKKLKAGKKPAMKVMKVKNKKPAALKRPSTRGFKKPALKQMTLDGLVLTQRSRSSESDSFQ